jgi:hypothetical protein
MQRQKETASCRPGLNQKLDIFSGHPNPEWILSGADGLLFLKKLAMLPQASAKELDDNLGYRGFIVKAINETGESLVRISMFEFKMGRFSSQKK